MNTLEITLTLIGGPTVLIEIAGLRLLTDPTFDEPRTYDARGIVLEKKKGPALAEGALGRVDAVLLSHDQHFDNLDHAGRELLKGAATTFTTPSGAERLRGSTVGLTPWQTAHLEGAGGVRISVTATPARHGPRGIESIAGEVTGFALGVSEPGDAIYISGDTVWYDGVAEVARRFRPRLVIVFAGAARPRGPYHVTMDTNDAIETAHAFSSSSIIAVHNDGWAHFTETQNDIVQAFSSLGLAARLQTLQAGRPERLVLG